MLFLSLLFVTSLLFSQNNIMKVVSDTVDVNSEICISIDIINDDEFVGFQSDILFPSDWELLDVYLFRDVDHQLSSHLVEDGLLRLISYSLTNSNFRGNEGSVIDIKLKTNDVDGKYPIKLKENIIASINAEDILTESIDGMVYVGDYEDSKKSIFAIIGGIFAIIIAAIVGFFSKKK